MIYVNFSLPSSDVLSFVGKIYEYYLQGSTSDQGTNITNNYTVSLITGRGCSSALI